MEPHYVLRSRLRIDHVSADEIREVRAPSRSWRTDAWAWGYSGSGALSTAVALLSDVAHDLSDEENERHDLGTAFVSDVLNAAPRGKPFVIAVREVRGWLDDRRAAVVERARAERAEESRTVTAEEWAQQLLEQLAEPQIGTWLMTYRTVHGEPDVT